MTIRELIECVAKVVGYHGKIEFDHVHPDGTPQKLLNIDRLKALGWTPKFGLEEGLRLSYEDFVNNDRMK